MKGFEIIYSLLATLGRRTSSIPGAIIIGFNGSVPNFSVSKCAFDAIVVDEYLINNSEPIRPGHIVVQLPGAEKSDFSICNKCNPLFRKIVSHQGQGVYTTTFATFAEIFPNDVYDLSLADASIEPLFQCNHSVNPSRFLSANTENTTNTTITESNQEYDDVEFCSYLSTLILALILSTCIFPPFSIFLGAPILFIVLAFASFFNVCGISSDSVFGGLTSNDADSGRRELKIHNYLIDKIVLAEDSSLFDQEGASFPTECDEWTKKSKNTGRCMFVDCDIASNADPSKCYSCGSSCSNGAICYDNNSDGLLHASSVLDYGHFNFGNSCCIQEYCYSSRYEKNVCDVNFYKTLTAQCNSRNQRLEIQFPLEISALSQHCNMLSALLYLQVKVFGHGAYKERQKQQERYNEEPVCNSDMDMIEF